MSRIKYDPPTFGPSKEPYCWRRPEQQAMLLAKAAHRAWSRWRDARHKGKEFPEKLNNAMRNLYRNVSETDIYFSGYEAGRKEERES